MRLLRPLLVLALLALPVLPGAAAGPTEPADRLARKTTESVVAACRRDLGQGEGCTALPGGRPQDLAAYEASEVHRALQLQYRLGDRLPLGTSSWVGTHNSFNSTSERATVSHSDSNQQLSLVDQLRVDVRSLELDVHWWPSATAGGARVPLVCHGEAGHEGCTTERTLRDRLSEVVVWMDANPDEVLFLYLEDHLDDEAGYAAGAQVLQDVLGSRLYRPADAGLAACTDLPLTLTREQVRSAGKQAFVMSGCGAGAAWGTHVFRYSPKTEDRPSDYAARGCGGFDPVATDPVLLRFYEDSTFVSAAAEPVGVSSVDDGLTPATTSLALRCGVDLLGFDQLLPTDGRLEALVWTFAPGELDAPDGSCAVQRGSDGRWAARGCGEQRPAACQAGDGSWRVTAPTTRAAAPGLCRAQDARFTTPARARDAALLQLATPGGADVWLPLRRTGGRWA